MAPAVEGAQEIRRPRYHRHHHCSVVERAEMTVARTQAWQSSRPDQRHRSTST